MHEWHIAIVLDTTSIHVNKKYKISSGLIAKSHRGTQDVMKHYTVTRISLGYNVIKLSKLREKSPKKLRAASSKRYQLHIWVG